MERCGGRKLVNDFSECAGNRRGNLAVPLGVEMPIINEVLKPGTNDPFRVDDGYAGAGSRLESSFTDCPHPQANAGTGYRYSVGVYQKVSARDLGYGVESGEIAPLVDMRLRAQQNVTPIVEAEARKVFQV